jgi:xylulokinase
MSLLGIDVGTTATKAVAFDREGRPLASAHRENPILDRGGGQFDFDTRAIRARLWEVLSEIAQATRRDPVEALSVSSCGEVAVPVDRGLNALGDAAVGYDVRGGDVTGRINREVGEFGVFRATGGYLSAVSKLAKVAWHRQARPGVYDGAWKFLGNGEWVCAMLGGEPVTTPSVEGCCGAMRADGEGYVPEMLRVAGVSDEKLPRIAPSGTAVGRMPEHTARELGFRPGVLLVTGGLDQQCAALGAAAVRPGQVSYGMGTVFCLTVVTPGPDLSEGMFRDRLSSRLHVVPGGHNTFVYNRTGGAILKWYRDTFGGQERARAGERGVDAYGLILEGMPPGPTRLLALPHFAPSGPPHLDADSRGAIVGLTLGTSRGEVVKGLLEGAAMEMRLGVELLERRGIVVDDFIATGGGARSDAWLRVHADIFGRPFRRCASPEAGCLGAAILAGVAAGAFASVEEAVERVCQTAERFEPDAGRGAIYRERLEVYRKLYPALREINHALAEKM